MNILSNPTLKTEAVYTQRAGKQTLREQKETGALNTIR